MELIPTPNYIDFAGNTILITHPADIPGGTVAAIPSKSHAHRLLIAAALSDAPVRLICPTTSKDIEATADCLRAMGAEITRTADGFLCRGIFAGSHKTQSDAHASDSKGAGATENAPKTVSLNVGESGSTLRFLLPVLGALGMNASLHMQGRLSQRPLSPLYEEMRRHGAILSSQGDNPLLIGGQLTAGTYTIDGGVSSQYITGLLFALPLLSEDSRLVITGKLESRPYVDITLQVLREFGITVHSTEPSPDTVPNATLLFDIPGGQTFHRSGITQKTTPQSTNCDPSDRPDEPDLDITTCLVEGDWSNAAFFLTAGALLENPVTVTGCNLNSAQGDKAILDLLQRFGAGVHTEPSHDLVDTFTDENVDASSGLSDITVCGGKLHGIDIDAADIPDLVPILSVIAAFAEGTTTIRNIGRLRIKESDRVATVLEMLSNLGAEAKVLTDSGEYLLITGKRTLPGGMVSSHNDHRIAMATAIASLRTSGPVVIKEPMAVQKSYPGFYEDLNLILEE